MADLLDPLAKTALWTASMRAREHERPDRLFSDPFAELLAGEEGPQIMRRFEGDVQQGVEDPALAVRTRFLDDKLIRLANQGITQFVFVAAGMDSRAFRLPWLPDTTVFELDRPAILHLKDDLLGRTRAIASCRRIPIGVDLLADWLSPLLADEFDPGAPTVWLAEGLLYFLDPSELDTLMHTLSDVSAVGSWFLADYVSRTSLESSSMRAWREQMASQGHAWKSGSDQPEQLMAQTGWVATITTYGGPLADYGRWARATIAPGMLATRGRYLIVAHRTPR